LLSIPVTSAVMAGERSAPPAHKAVKAEPGDDEPYSSIEAAGDQLFILDDSIISRDLAQVPGLTPEDSPDHTEGKADKAPFLEGLDMSSDPQGNLARQLEKKEAREEDKRLQAEKEAQRIAAAKKAQETSKTSPTTTQVKTSQTSHEEESSTVKPPSQGQFLLEIANPDAGYRGRPLQVSDRQTLEGLVMGEWGNDYIGAVLVAQCIRDSMVKEGVNSAAVIKRRYGYTAPVKRQVSQTVKDAVAYVFDQGGSGVQHPIYYFYASNLVQGRWHESQKFIVQRKAVRFFSPHR
ncbi:MAG TPA: hypothetical protein VFD14_03135, partial [Clostridia bacterium]|nr:hypothetical protein [Clostridia bacterium]